LWLLYVFAVGGFAGRSSRNVVPRPGALSSVSFAPITSAARDAIVSPSPTPL
jgi:hypothetical protein